MRLYSVTIGTLLRSRMPSTQAPRKPLRQFGNVLLVDNFVFHIQMVLSGRQMLRLNSSFFL